jgi:hypothetical protein
VSADILKDVIRSPREMGFEIPDTIWRAEQQETQEDRREGERKLKMKEVAFSYSGGRNQRKVVLKRAQANRSRDLSQKNPSQKRAGGMAQGVGPEFKSQYSKKRKEQAWWHRPIILTPGRQRQEDHKSSLGYIASSRLA